MNKLELIEALRKETGIPRPDAQKIVALFFDEMANTLVRGDRVEIRGLCSFYVKKYPEYVGRNPKTGEKVKVRKKKLPFFKCGKGLRDRINGKGEAG